MIINIQAQEKKDSSFNFGFENIKDSSAVNWLHFGSPAYKISIDSASAYKGKYAATISYDGQNPNFSALSFELPDNYDGREIALTGYIKTEHVTGGYAGLWMRIDPRIAFDNMQSRGITGTTDWKRYEITLPMKPAGTKQILVGGLLVGKGKMWLDDLEVKIDGKPVEKLKPYQPVLLKADMDTAFNQGSGITSISTDSITLENLRVLGLVWGFLKYYHPAIAAGDYNWDYELFRILHEVAKARTVTQRSAVLTSWIRKFGPVKDTVYPVYTPQKIKLAPDLAWITGPKISKALSSALQPIINAARPEQKYYIGSAPGAGNPLFKHEKAYDYMDFPDAGYRLLALFRYWNMVQYFYPYKNLFKEDWKAVLSEFIPKVLACKTQEEYALTLLELIGRVHDTHANIYGGAQKLQHYFGARRAAPILGFVGHKAVVKGFYDKELGEKTGLLKGDEIVKIDNKDLSEIIKDHLKITPASNYPTQLRNMSAILLQSNNSSVNVTLKRDGDIQQRSLKTYTTGEMMRTNMEASQKKSFSLLPQDIGYLYLGTIKNAELPAIFKKLKGTKGLIIDLRCYPSEFTVFTLTKYLMPEPKAFVKFSIAESFMPGLFINSEPLKVGSENPNYYRGKVVILVNETTQSQAEYTTMALRVTPGAIVLGSTTAGADGNVSPISLPGGISTMISGIGVYYPDGTETQQIGIVPDVVLKPTIEGIKEGRDELLDKAIEIIQTGKY